MTQAEQEGGEGEGLTEKGRARTAFGALMTPSLVTWFVPFLKSSLGFPGVQTQTFYCLSVDTDRRSWTPLLWPWIGLSSHPRKAPLKELIYHGPFSTLSQGRKLLHHHWEGALPLEGAHPQCD